MTYSLKYNNFDTSSNGWTCYERHYGSLEKRKNELTVPYRSGTVDTSTVYKKPIFENRTMTFKFWKKCKSFTEVNAEIKKVEQAWLTSVGKSKLQDNEQSWYYKAECTAIDSDESTRLVARFTATFSAYPYAINQDGSEVI